MSNGARGGQRGSGAWACGWLVVVALLVAMCALAPTPVQAALTTYYVGTTADAGGGTATTCASATNTTCTLRDAINFATSGSDTITFTAAAFPASVPTTITLTNGQLNVTTAVVIKGTGHQVTVAGTGTGGDVFTLTQGSGQTVTMALLTITGGVRGINNNIGTVTVTGITISGTSSSGIENGGTVTVTSSTISGNGDSGIFNRIGTTTVTNSTISGNQKGILNLMGTVNATNNLIVNNTGGDVVLNGINGTNTANLTGAFTFASPLQNNGGPTPTLAIPTSVPAYQTGNVAACQAISGPYDQRGAPRVVAGTCSIGAFEPGLVPTTTALTATPTSAPFGSSVTFTATVAGVRGNPPPDSTGSVTFTNGGATLGTANLVGGTATFTMTTLPPGNSVTATYTAGGAGNPYAASPASNAVSVTITPISCVVISTADPSESGKLTLRDATNAANAGACTSNTITFDPTLFATPHTITLGSTLTLSHDVTIDGTGRQVVVDGGCTKDLNSDCTSGGSTVFFIASGNVTLRALTIQHGNGYQSGGIYNNNVGGTLTVTNSTFAHNSASYYGGGIFNAGPLAVTNSTFANNSAPTTGGGGIFNYLGALTVTGSTFVNNSADRGGGILTNESTITVTNSTFANNSASTQGGGIWNNGATQTVTNSTLANNSAPIGGGTFNNSGILTVTNSMLAGNAGGDVNNTGTITDGGHNLVGSSSGYTFSGPGDTSGPALLTPLGTYGGGTQTVALLPGSAALGGGDPAVCAAAPVGGTDQRGATRPDPGTTACDIGAFESQGFALTKTSGDNQSVAFTGASTPFAPLTATITSKDIGVSVNGGTLTFTIVPGTSSATFGAAGSTGCTVSMDGRTASGCTVNAMGVATSPAFTGTVIGSFTIAASATPGDAAEATYTETVSKATPTVGVTSSTMGTSVFGQSVTFTATVTGVIGTLPTGTVQFAYTASGSTTRTVIGTSVILDLTGKATVSTSTLPVGANAIIATYSGDGTYLTSSGTVAQSVTVASTTTSVTAMPATSTAGQSVTLTATLAVTAPGAGTPTGTVTFTLGGTTLGTGTVNGSGVATLATAALPVGANQTLTATYSGNGTYLTSSGTTTVTVNPVTLTLTAPTGNGNSGTASAPSIRVGGSITLGANPSTGVTYTSSNANVASVDPNTGAVTGISGGTAVITASGPNGSSGSITVTVVGGTGTGLMAPAPAPMVHTGAVTAAPGATVAPQPMSHATGNGTGGGVGPQAVGQPMVTPEAQPARH